MPSLRPRARIRLTLVTGCLATVLAGGVSGPVGASVAGAASAAPGERFTIRSEEPVFWDGPYVDSTTPGSPQCGGDPCWDWELDVVETGYRLRVGIDHPEIGDVFTVSLYRPDGGLQGTFGPGSGLYSAELTPTPMVGVWRVRVTASDVDDSAFRMRAKLEAAPPSIGDGPDVLPNFQVLPPHDPGFIAPITNGATGEEPQPLDVMGVHPLSCHAEEHAEEQAVRCLRFGFGVKNTGLGPMQLYYNGNPPGDQTLYQRIERVNGSFYDRVAGLARWHKTHVHYHHHDAVALRLYRVTDPATGALEAIGPEHRKGFAHRSELLREWRNFYPTTTLAIGFGLRPGWADIYEWDRPGNYIDFGLNGDGRYLIRMVADPVNGVVESNEVDNAGYTYLKVTGEDVEMLETGRGSDPWDPCKIVVPFGGQPEPPPDPDAPPRPETCPPDTT